MSAIDTIDYDGLTLHVETVETDLLRGDECVGHGLRVVGIELVQEGPVEDVKAVCESSWYDGWLGQLEWHGFNPFTTRVFGGRALAAWLTSWGGDHLLDELTERLNARRRDAEERAEEEVRP